MAHKPVGRLDEAELVHSGIGRQRAEQPDVGAFRRLNGAYAPVMREVHITHVEAGALPRETTGTQGRQAPLVRELGQRVGLVHELRQLRSAEELAHRRHNRPDVDQPLRCGCFRVHQRHLLLDHALHAEQAHPDLVLHQFAHCPHAAVAQVIDVVYLALALVDNDHHSNDGDDVVAGQGHGAHAFGQCQSAIELVAPNASKVVPPRLEKQVVDQVARVLQAGRLPRPETAVELDLRPCYALGRFLVEFLALMQPLPQRAKVLLPE